MNKNLSSKEYELIEKFRACDSRGKDLIRFMIDHQLELSRKEKQKKFKVIKNETLE